MIEFGNSRSDQLFEPGKLLVTFYPGVTSQERLNSHSSLGAVLIVHIPELNFDIVSVEPGKELEYKAKYIALAVVRHVELNYYGYPAFKPNDPFYKKKTITSLGFHRQWGLSRINPKPAWGMVHCLTPYAKVAVIDTGIDPNHPDLADKIIDPVNFFNSDPSDYIDRNGHGTLVAGIVAAITNNKTGVAGTSFNTAYIMPIKVAEDYYNLDALIQGVIYAIRKGANIINMSISHRYYMAQLQDAINLAWEQGIVCIASVGAFSNEQTYYPAGNNFVLGVAATDKLNNLASFSNWGVNVGIAAPGTAILSTTPTYPVPGFLPNYDAADGTSFSCPFVSGVAAMMLSVNHDLTNREIIRFLQQSAKSVRKEPDGEAAHNLKNNSKHHHRKDKEWSPIWGYGILKAEKAVKMAKDYHFEKDGLGSFYGQVIDKQTGLPKYLTYVSAFLNGVEKKRYMTSGFEPSYGVHAISNGMFRLWNIPKGIYSIQVNFIEVMTAELIPGSDTFLKLLV